MPVLAPEPIRLRQGGGVASSQLAPQSLALASGGAVTARALSPQRLAITTANSRGTVLRAEVLKLGAPGSLGVQAQLPLERVGLKDRALLISETGSEIRLVLPLQLLRLAHAERVGVELRPEAVRIRATGGAGLAQEFPVKRLRVSPRLLVGELRPIQGSVGMRSAVSRSEPFAGFARRAGSGLRLGYAHASPAWANAERSGAGGRSLTASAGVEFAHVLRSGQGSRGVIAELSEGFGRAFRVGSGERAVRGLFERGEGRSVRGSLGAQRDARGWAEFGDAHALRFGAGLRALTSWGDGGFGDAQREAGEGQRNAVAYLAASWSESFRAAEGVRQAVSHVERANATAYRRGGGERSVRSPMEGAQGSATRIGVGFRRVVGWVQISWALAESFVYGPVERGAVTAELEVSAPDSRLEVKGMASSLKVSAKG